MPETGSDNSANSAASGESTHNNVSNKALLLDQMDSIPVFSGSDPVFPFEKFYLQFADYAKWLHWNEADQLFILKQKLTGRAQRIVDSHEGTLKSAKQIFDKLRERLASKTASVDLVKQFWNFKQEDDMIIEDFCAIGKKKALEAMKALNLPEEQAQGALNTWLLDMFMDNVHPKYRKQILAQRPKTPQEFEKIAKNEEFALNAISKQSPKAETFTLTNSPVIPDPLMEKLSRQIENLAAELDKCKGENLRLRRERDMRRSMSSERGGQSYERSDVSTYRNPSRDSSREGTDEYEDFGRERRNYTAINDRYVSLSPHRQSNQSRESSFDRRDQRRVTFRENSQESERRGLDSQNFRRGGSSFRSGRNFEVENQPRNYERNSRPVMRGSNRGMRNNSNIVCFRCDMKGHKKSECQARVVFDNVNRRNENIGQTSSFSPSHRNYNQNRSNLN